MFAQRFKEKIPRNHMPSSTVAKAFLTLRLTGLALHNINRPAAAHKFKILSTMSDFTAPEWTPLPKIEDLFEKALAGNKWASINAPTAGAKFERLGLGLELGLGFGSSVTLTITSNPNLSP
jgi:hypothetical protein